MRLVDFLFWGEGNETELEKADIKETEDGDRDSIQVLTEAGNDKPNMYSKVSCNPPDSLQKV